MEEFPKYLISNYGRVMNVETNKILNGSINNKGYRRYDLCYKGKRFVRSGHRLVADAFIPKIDGKNTINHIDGNKTNNIVSNLEWCSVKENMVHAFNVLNIKQSNMRPVICIETNEVFESCRDAARHIGASNSSISRCCNKKRNSVSGFHFNYL